MDLSLSAEQWQLSEVVSSFLEKESTLERVRAAEPLGFDGLLWDKFIALGVVAMGLPRACGGDDASLLDLALVAELVGAALAPVPFIDSVVAARLLASVGAPDALVTTVGAGSVATVGLFPSDQGLLRLAPSGALAEVVIGLDGADLVAARSAAPKAAPANLACSPVADRSLANGQRIVLASGEPALAAHARAVDEWRTLTSAAVTGLAQTALDLAVAYAKTRKQFGIPIGAFQALAHRLADASIAVSGSRLLAREAAWAAAEDPARFSELAAMACAFGAETAEQVAGDSVHVHGGVGFSLEGDPQLFFRRAKGWPLAIGGAHSEYQVVADRVLEPESC